MSLQIFKPTFRVDECLEQVRECLEKGWTGLGFKTVEFENQWKDYTGFKHAHFVNSATSGLHLAVHILKKVNNWDDDSEVISTPLTFVSTNHAIMYENLKIQFADVDEQLCLDPTSVKNLINKKTKAIMFVGIGGNTGQYKEIVKLCKKHKLALILDAAHMAGTRLDGEIAGKEADAVVYSFQAVKNLPTADSGMVCFKKKEHDELARKLTWLGINKDTYARTSSKGAYKWKYDVEHVGFKYHGNSIMAGIAMVQLQYLDRDNAYRRQLAEWYDEGFGDDICTIGVAEGCESSRHLYMIKVNNRDELLLALNNCQIYPGVHYRINTEYRMYKPETMAPVNAENYNNQILSLPMHMEMTKKDVEFVVEKVKAYAKN
jgi:dTDP-4-amino-4,6-dideoxygalactose transaminase